MIAFTRVDEEEEIKIPFRDEVQNLYDCVICATLTLFGFGSLAMCWCYVIFHFIARRQRSKSLHSGAEKKL